MINVLLLLFVAASVAQIIVLIPRRDDFRTDIVLLTTGTLWTVMYLLSDQLLRNSKVIPLWDLWQSYQVAFLVYVGRAFFMSRGGTLRVLYLSSLIFLIMPILVWVGIFFLFVLA